MRNVSKNIFLNAIVCPSLGWKVRNGILTTQNNELPLGERFRIEQGKEIHKRARDVYPNGVLIEDFNVEAAANRTRTLMADPNVSTILEGTFIIDGFTTKADILIRDGNSWHLIEVKSKVNDEKQLIDDMAYTAMVLGRCGTDISKISLMLISKEFRLGMGNEELFREIDHTAEVLERVGEFQLFWGLVESETRSETQPEPELRFECRKCEIFKDCLNRGIENHIFDLPRISQPKFDSLKESGILSIEGIPNTFPLTPNQARVRECVINNVPFIGHRLGNELSSIVWPAFYLDFETVNTVIPLYENVAPYTQIPTQYSIHKCSGIGQVNVHSDYLAEPDRDCRRELAERLINDLQGEGSIIAYSSFEKRVINELAGLFPDLSDELNSLIARIVDLEAIIRKQFYHPDFHGSTSIKRTLPVLVPDMTYEGLEIVEGDSAMAAFAYMALGEIIGNEAETVKINLLKYCKQDTLAMVKLHQRLAGYA